ncbi:hypothetical protein K502DRAFT_346103 [Neoconidiobolus thromboides FSU 785]|nr:hypothetical protein K502DRAFT_346103 [Neoconidiobolus thromboides FSU 785]
MKLTVFFLLFATQFTLSEGTPAISGYAYSCEGEIFDNLDEAKERFRKDGIKCKCDFYTEKGVISYASYIVFEKKENTTCERNQQESISLFHPSKCKNNTNGARIFDLIENNVHNEGNDHTICLNETRSLCGPVEAPIAAYKEL